jgi:ribose-phosphate pyrophosphokinase
MDRVKSRKDVFTLKSFCNVINGMKFDRVIVRDVHSNVSLALLNNAMLQEPTYFIEKAKEKCGAPVLFYPDEGAMKRYSSLIKAPFSFGIKDRDWDTGVIKGLNIMNPDEVKGKDVLIVDDICSRGGTFFHSAKALKSAGANKIYLYVTHLETTVFDGELLNSGLVEKIYTTNSIFPKEKQSDMIEILE